MHNKTLKELSTLLHSKQISSAELTRHYLDRIAASRHNAFLHVDTELSLAQAKAADARLAMENSAAAARDHARLRSRMDRIERMLARGPLPTVRRVANRVRDRRGG